MYKQLPLAISSDSSATFESFYTSLTNRISVLALKQYIEQVDEPLFYLSGRSGCGITHLMNAVQNANKTFTIQYLPLKELIQYPPEDIMDGIERLDLVCVDDIEIATGNAAWEENLFHLFNRLRDQGKRLLVGSHTSPRNLSFDLADLTSRLQWGLSFKIELLNDDEKQLAMQFCADNLGIQLPDEVARYLLQRAGRETEQLFTMVRQLDQASLAEQRRLTIPFVKKILGL
ncbi:MAG: DnaA regulatory inactivator Hda [Cellvibrionaceae bacterium]